MEPIKPSPPECSITGNVYLFGKSCAPPPLLGQKAPPQSIFTQITPCYRPHFRIFRPIINVFLRVCFYIFSRFPALLSSIFSTFWTYNKCEFDYFVFLGKRGSMRLLARIVPYYQLFFEFFWPIYVFFFRKRGKMLKITAIIGQKSRKSTR